MGRLLSLDQIEKGKQLRESLGKLNSLKKRIDKILVTEEEGQKDFDLSLEPNKEEVVMNINGLEYYEDESFTVDRKKRKLQWNGAFDISPKLNISTEGHRKYPKVQYTGITCYSQAVRIQYLSDETYDGLLDPDCVGMFQDDQELREAPELNLERIRSTKNMFAGCSSLTTVPEYSFSNVQDMTEMFSECRSLVTAVQLDTQNVVTMDGTFAACASLTSVPKLDTSNVVVMNNLFRECRTLNTVPLLDTQKVKSMSYMFWYCTNLTTVPLFDTSNVQDMRGMFYNCNKLTTVPSFNTSNVQDMRGMFQYCYKLTTVPSFNTSNVQDMSYMFHGCDKLTAVPSFDTSNVQDMSGMFRYCNKLTTVPSFNTSNVQDMSYMFYSCDKLITIGKLDLTGITERYHMPDFYFCSSLENIRFDPKSIHYSISFRDNSKLTKASLLSILNGLGVPKMERPVLTLHSTSKALLSADELKIATDKGWTVQ